jgi:hypothetical protein
VVLSRSKYKRIPELYVQGTELVFKDGTVMWLQVLNPFEADEARHDAQVARSRIVMALKSEHGSPERMKAEAAFWGDGRDSSIERMADAKASEKLLEITENIRSDPEWKERLEVLDRSEELIIRPPEDVERAYLDATNTEYLTEINRRLDEERAFHRMRLTALVDVELIEDYIDLYIDRRGGELAMAEYALTQMWYAARACEGVQLDDGAWDHGACEGHQVQVFERKAEVRGQPEDLQDLISDGLRALEMTVREAKNSARQGSSSASLPLPSEPAESTPSTSTETLVAVPGT